jgi:hypothetical protein
VIASLPVSLATAAGVRGDLIALAGTPGWTQRALGAVADGCLGIVVVDPVNEPVGELARLTEEKGIPVVLDHRWASHPAVDAMRDHAADRAPEIVLVDVTITVDTAAAMDAALDESRRILAGLFTPQPDLDVLARAAGSIVAGGSLGGASPVTVTVAVAPSERWPVRALAVTESGDIDLRLPDPDAAQPATLTVTDEHGSRRMPTRFESAHRSAWRRVVDLARAGQGCADLGEFARASH